MTAHEEIDFNRADEPAARLFGPCLASLHAYSHGSAELRRALLKLAGIGDPATRKAALRLVHQLGAVEPSVTMIGQVKAGKTSLVNAMIGMPGLLPADVNPWTSVVTTLHASPPTKDLKVGARFRFFDDEEWKRLIDSGGRIGELAERAGADEELEKVRIQITEMREKSRRRLGSKFELLLGQEHDYGYVDRDLIERYVCLGDDFEDDNSASKTQGRFADITKSADITLPIPALPIRLAIRDTPGVNDTFMMREQITISAIRDSRLCVVVFSAHQALTSMDMALVRMIANVKSREVLIFVNRIDELADPTREVAEIRERILVTMKRTGDAVPPQIIFGSALWANASLQDTIANLPDDSAAAMSNWSETTQGQIGSADPTPDDVWDLSGLPALYKAIAERIVEGPGRDALQRIARSALNLAKGVEAADRFVATTVSRRLEGGMSAALAAAEIDRCITTTEESLATELDKALGDYQARLDRAHRAFLERATSSLIGHLERYGEKEVWHYNPDGLRVLLRSNYMMFGNAAQKSAQSAMDHARGRLAAVLSGLIDLPPDQCPIAMPGPLRVPPPVSLAQTIALDLQAGWWKSWWFRRRGYQAYTAQFLDLIKAETEPMLSELLEIHARTLTEAAMSQVREFLDEQRSIIMNVAGKSEMQPEALRTLLGLNAQEDRRATLHAAIKTFTRFVQ